MIQHHFWLSALCCSMMISWVKKKKQVPQTSQRHQTAINSQKAIITFSKLMLMPSHAWKMKERGLIYVWALHHLNEVLIFSCRDNAMVMRVLAVYVLCLLITYIILFQVLHRQVIAVIANVNYVLLDLNFVIFIGIFRLRMMLCFLSLQSGSFH